MLKKGDVLGECKKACVICLYKGGCERVNVLIIGV